MVIRTLTGTKYSINISYVVRALVRYARGHGFDFRSKQSDTFSYSAVIFCIFYSVEGQPETTYYSHYIKPKK